MAYNDANPVSVGNSTRKDQWDRLFDNARHVYKYLIAGLPFWFGGDAGSPVTQNAYPSGATFDKLAPDTGVFVLDVDDLPTSGTVVLEAVLAAETPATTSLALVNLSDGAPDTAIVEISSSSTTGARVVSAAITFAAGTAKTYGVKIKGSDAVKKAWAWNIQLRPTV